MKLLITTAAALMLTVSGAMAQTAISGSASQANAGAVSGSVAKLKANNNQSIYVDQRAVIPGTQRVINEAAGTHRSVSDNTSRVEQSGTVTNKFAPAISPPAMGSGHPCGLGNSLGITIIGGGVAGGATISDDACLLAQMGHTTAATAMIAARNPSACRALVASGDISPKSMCGDSTRQEGGVYQKGAKGPIAKPKNGTPLVVKPSNSGNVAPELAAASSQGPVCFLKAGTTRTVVTNALSEKGRRECANSLGL